MPTAPHLLTVLNAIERGIRVLRAAAREAPWRLSFFGLLALIATWPALAKGAAMNDFRDAHVIMHYVDAARRSVVQFHELPLWDPYYCGGTYALGSPQASYVAPTFLLTLLFGTLRADALIRLFMIVVGLEGAYRYALLRSARPLGAALAAPIFALSGLFAYAPSFGWINFFSFELLPWVAVGVHSALRGNRRGVVVAAVAVAWMVGLGGTYAVPLAFVFCAFEGLEALAHQATSARSAARVLGMALAVALLALGMSAIRLWPVIETLRSTQRLIGGTPSNTPADVLRMLFTEGAKDQPKQAYVITLFPIPLALLGAFQWRRALPLLAAGATFLWLAIGYGVGVSLFALLRELPLYTLLRYPERFLTLFALVFAGLVGMGFNFIDVRARRSRAWQATHLLAIVLLAGAYVELVTNHQTETNGVTFVAPPPEVPREFHQARGNRWALEYYAAMGRGSLSCFDAYDVPQSPRLRGNLEAEAYLREPDAGSVTQTSWSPNRIALDVDLTHPTRVYVNQNWHRGWRASAGEVVSERGLLAVDLPAGHHALTLHFAPQSAIGGALTSLAAILVAVLLWRAQRQARVVRGARAWIGLVGLTLVPGVAAAGVALIDRESVPPVELLGQDGEAIVISAPPAGARALHTRFAGGVDLESASATLEPGPHPSIRIELDWRIGPKVARGMGVFVHLQPSAGDQVKADHARLSSTIPFEDAPRGALVRDVMTVVLPTKDKDTTWSIYAGLWYERRGGDRVAITQLGSASADDGRVFIGPVEVPGSPDGGVPEASSEGGP